MRAGGMKMMWGSLRLEAEDGDEEEEALDGEGQWEEDWEEEGA